MDFTTTPWIVYEIQLFAFIGCKKKIRKEDSTPLFSNVLQNWLHLMQAYMHEIGKAKSNLEND